MPEAGLRRLPALPTLPLIACLGACLLADRVRLLCGDGILPVLEPCREVA
jgi:hypothetical protein